MAARARLSGIDEQALAAHLGQRTVQDLVATGRHAQQFDGQAEALITADKALLILARREKMAGRFRIMAPDVALDEVLTAPARATECGRALARGDIQ